MGVTYFVKTQLFFKSRQGEGLGPKRGGTPEEREGRKKEK
jgi:hypothetical protein